MLLIEYLDNGSPDTPLVRIYGVDTAAFLQLGKKLEELATRAVERVCLTELPGFRGARSCRLDLLAAGKDIGVFQSSPGTFVWTQRPECWDLAAGLAEPFGLEVLDGSFQWLAGPNSSLHCREGTMSLLVSCTADGEW